VAALEPLEQFLQRSRAGDRRGAAVPYGGFRMSGFGKELGREALDSYLQTKTVWIDLS